MSAEDEGPRSQKTVFRPSPLSAKVGAHPISGEPLLSQRRTISASQEDLPPAAQAMPARRAMIDDDVAPLAVPMRVRNPVMASAARLLALAAAVQAERQVADPVGLLRRASDDARAFEKTLASLGLSEEDKAKARYAVLATLDDIVQNLPGGATSDWARQSLVVQSFGQSFGGDQFWTILDTMLARPSAHLELLELYHACLAVGFQGRFRVSADGQRQLSNRMAAIFTALSDIRPRPENDLVPAWRGRPTPARKVGWLSRGLLVAGALAAFLALVFVSLMVVLSSRDEAPSLALRQILPPYSARIDRAGADVPAAVSSQFERITARIAHPCTDGFDDGATIRLVIASCPDLPVAIFDKGAVAISQPYAEVIAGAARALAPEPGPVQVVAHTDADPIRGMLLASYPDNYALSSARADNVVQLIEGLFDDPSRLTGEGGGDREPIDRSNSVDANARNRRVELIIPRSE